MMVGAGTVLADDPSLRVNDVAPTRQPATLVVDAAGRVPVGARLFSNHDVVVATTESAPPAVREGWAELGADVLVLAGSEGGVDLAALLGELVAKGIGSVMVEGGATLITAFFRAGLVDRLAVCVAPKILGKGIEAIGDLGIRDLSRSLTLADAAVESYGVDLILSGRVEYPDGVQDRG